MNAIRRISPRDHLRFAFYPLSLFAVMAVVVIGSVLLTEISAMLVPFLIAVGAVTAIHIVPLTTLHFQYWKCNRNTGMELEGDLLRLYEGESPVNTVDLGCNETAIEKVIGAARKLPDFCFFYSIRENENSDPVILTSLLTGECPRLDALADVRKPPIPFLDA